MERLLTVVLCAGLLGCDADDGRPPAAGQGGDVVLEDGRVCAPETAYLDEDHDGFGIDGVSMPVCLSADQEVEGYALGRGDCAPEDPFVSPGADEICGDHLDENCNDADERCPTSLEAGIKQPDWDCLGDPPDNVLAWALFDQENEYYRPGACFIFFEGLPDEFYVKPVNLEPTQERAARGPGGRCEAVEGCICPSIENWSYDRGRLYAMTLHGDPDDCEKIVVFSHEGSEQVVSNECRKYLFQMHFNPQEIAFLSNSEDRLRRRLERFDQVEIACFEGQPFDDLPFASLLTAEIQLSERFAKMK